MQKSIGEKKNSSDSSSKRIEVGPRKVWGWGPKRWVTSYVVRKPGREIATTINTSPRLALPPSLQNLTFPTTLESNVPTEPFQSAPGAA